MQNYGILSQMLPSEKKTSPSRSINYSHGLLHLRLPAASSQSDSTRVTPGTVFLWTSRASDEMPCSQLLKDLSSRKCHGLQNNLEKREDQDPAGIAQDYLHHDKRVVIKIGVRIT